MTPEIVRYLPELLQDFWELGSDPDLVVGWLEEEGLGEGERRVLDLGCGKGAVSLAVAERLGCRVRGVDALPAFVEIARAEARRRSLDRLCRFEHGDIREVVQGARDYDAVLLISVGVLGSVGDIVAKCRRCVGPGGLMVVDHAYLNDPQAIEFNGYEELSIREETLRQLGAHGDRLVRERVIPLDEVRSQNRRYNQWIESRAHELSAAHPEHARAFSAYVEKEHQECRILESSVTCATWMLRRG